MKRKSQCLPPSFFFFFPFYPLFFSSQRETNAIRFTCCKIRNSILLPPLFSFFLFFSFYCPSSLPVKKGRWRKAWDFLLPFSLLSVPSFPPPFTSPFSSVAYDPRGERRLNIRYSVSARLLRTRRSFFFFLFLFFFSSSPYLFSLLRSSPFFQMRQALKECCKSS